MFGLATPSEAAAIGALGQSGPRRRLSLADLEKLKESVFLTARTSAMVGWLFVGSFIFSAVFAALGGDDVIKDFVVGLDLSPLTFLIISQIIIFILGWPLEWTEIIVIFVPIFLPLLDHFGIDPLFFGLLIALNIQTSFLSPPVAMAPFYLKGVAPTHVTINDIFAGVMPFILIVLVAMVLLYLSRKSACGCRGRFTAARTLHHVELAPAVERIDQQQAGEESADMGLQAMSLWPVITGGSRAIPTQMAAKIQICRVSWPCLCRTSRRTAAPNKPLPAPEAPISDVSP